ncbi:MAG: hypothetical protein IPJ52_05730 [Rhodocyclaceae bacterium]|nr:hypothetical protein [Rhodocyclaceae bacterium]
MGTETCGFDRLVAAPGRHETPLRDGRCELPRRGGQSQELLDLDRITGAPPG